MAQDSPLSDPRDYIVEISGQVVAGGDSPASHDADDTLAAAGRPYLSVHFKCCSTYNRIYKTADGAAYAGHCPKCAKPVRIKIGPGGSSTRLFTAE